VKKNSTLQVLSAFAVAVVGWLLTNHFVDMVTLWNTTKAKLRPEPQPAPPETFRPVSVSESEGEHV